MAFYHPLKSYEEDPDYPDKAKFIAERLLTLRHDLWTNIVKDRQPNSLIVGSWNIRAFDGGLPRMDESYHYIAEIIDKFDVCAIQEVKKSLAPLKRVVGLLGPQWDYFVSDTSTHKGGNSERMAFIYNTNRVVFRNLIGEVVVDNSLGGGQPYRSPFFASFQAGWFKFSLCSAHIAFVDDLKYRAAEISAVANALTKRSKDEDQVHIFLGDMNIESEDDVAMDALAKSGLEIPDFGATNMAGDRWFDQITFTVRGKAKRKTRLLRHGKFDWRDAVFATATEEDPLPPTDDMKEQGISRMTSRESKKHYEKIVCHYRTNHGETPYSNWNSMYNRWTTNEMSDHLPIWIELETDYSDDYLRKFI